MKLTQKVLLEHLEYKDGNLVWKKLAPRNFSSKVGEQVGSANSTGRLCFRLFGQQMQNHRAIFLMHHGWLPEIVDHIDGDFKNNKIENLRAADKTRNGQNSKTPKSNSSGVKGVDLRKGLWRARIVVSGKSLYLGSFKDIDQAKLAVQKAREQQHKEFARHA